MIVHAHAKINWALDILGKRTDGYHEMDMLMQRLALHDTLEIAAAEEVALTCEGLPFQNDENNLILQAARALNAACGTCFGARIRLVKRIPAHAGLGGGSADCAAALVALNELWQLGLAREALLTLAARLGADVPYCMTGGLMRVGGVGERLTRAGQGMSIWLVLVQPQKGLATRDVFAAWDDGGQKRVPIEIAALARALEARDLIAAAAAAGNVLEEPAQKILPEIADKMRCLRAAGAPLVRMTGSGSVVFGAFATEKEAARAAQSIPNALCTHTLSE